MRALLLRRHAACALAAACVLPPPRSGAADYATTEEAAARQVEAELQQTARFFREPPIFPLLARSAPSRHCWPTRPRFASSPVLVFPPARSRCRWCFCRSTWSGSATSPPTARRGRRRLVSTCATRETPTSSSFRHRRRAWPAARPRRGVRRPRSGCVEARRGRAADARAAAAEGPAEPREASAEGGRRDGEAFRRWPVYSCPVRLAHGTGQGQPLRADIRWTSSRTVEYPQ